jgi:hypothetical protein
MPKAIVADIDPKIVSLGSKYGDRLVYSNYFVPIQLTFSDGETPVLPFYRKQDLLDVAHYGPIKEEQIRTDLEQLGLSELWALNKLDAAAKHLPVPTPAQPARQRTNPSPGQHQVSVKPSVKPIVQAQARPSILDNQSLEFISGLLQSDVGIAFLDRTRIRPAGFALGEHVYALGLAPGEQVVLEQKTFSKREMTYEQQDEQEQQFDIELSSTLSTSLEEGLDREQSTSNSWGLSLSHTGTYTSPTGTWGTFNASHTIGYTKNVSDAHQETARRSVKDSRTASSKVAAKYRTQHKTTFKLSTEQTFETTSKRTVTNPNRTTPITLNYFKVLQCLELKQERYGVRLCWAPAVKNPALTFYDKIRKGRQSILDDAAANIPPPPEEPKPSTEAGAPSTTTVGTKWVESELIAANSWHVDGGMRADYQVDLPQPDGFDWDEDTGAIESSLSIVSDRPHDTISRYLVGSPYAVQDDEGPKLRVTVRIEAPPWLGGPGIEFQLGARFRQQVTTTAQDNQDTKYNDDLTAYRTALSDWTQKRDEAMAQAQTAANAFEQQMLQSLSPINEMVSQIIEQHFPPSVRDECWEIDYWQRLFDWERASFVAYPAWWSSVEARDPLLDPSDFLNASWAKLYLPVRAGMERLALRWIYGKAIVSPLAHDVEARIDALVKDVSGFRQKYFGTPDETAELTEECQAVDEQAYCIAAWQEVMPTDGTHLEVIQGFTTAADAITSREIDDAATLRTALIDNEQKRSTLKDKAASQITEPAKVIVRVGDVVTPSAG